MTAQLMPALFIGHGSPMNALEDNLVTKRWRELYTQIPHPQAILVISAHWYISKLEITSQEENDTVHDFYGFPEKLANFAYPSSGSPKLAAQIQSILQPEYALDLSTNKWGLDHGAWSILTHIYPNPDMPILQLSIDSSQIPNWHYKLGQKLVKLRELGILIIGSGNIVHNLGQLNWHKPTQGEAWATSFDQMVIDLIQKHDLTQLCAYLNLGDNAKLAIPTPEHYLPLLYILGVVTKDDKLKIFNQFYQYGSLSMTSLIVGK